MWSTPQTPPLGWWQKVSRVYPHIAMLTRRSLAVQAPSAASERVFSVGERVVTNNKRNRLGAVRVKRKHEAQTLVEGSAVVF